MTSHAGYDRLLLAAKRHLEAPSANGSASLDVLRQVTVALEALMVTTTRLNRRVTDGGGEIGRLQTNVERLECALDLLSDEAAAPAPVPGEDINPALLPVGEWSETTYWTQRDGVRIAFEDMTTEHRDAVIEMLERNARRTKQAIIWADIGRHDPESMEWLTPDWLNRPAIEITNATPRMRKLRELQRG